MQFKIKLILQKIRKNEKRQIMFMPLSAAFSTFLQNKECKKELDTIENALKNMTMNNMSDADENLRISMSNHTEKTLQEMMFFFVNDIFKYFCL